MKSDLRGLAAYHDAGQRVIQVTDSIKLINGIVWWRGDMLGLDTNTWYTLQFCTPGHMRDADCYILHFAEDSEEGRTFPVTYFRGKEEEG